MKRWALALLFLAGCATAGPAPEPAGYLRIENGNWYAKTVRLFCGGTQQLTVRGLVTNQTRVSPIRTVCNDAAYLVVEYEGSRGWVSPAFYWNEGETIRLELGPGREGSYNWVWKAQ